MTSWPSRCSRSRCRRAPEPHRRRVRAVVERRVRLRASRRRATRTGSSMLPQKKNPDIAELARGKAGPPHRQPHRSAGDAQGLAARVQPRPAGGQGAAVRRGRPGAARRCRAITGMLGHAHVRRRPDAGRRRPPYAAATDLAEYLVAQGMPFRDAARRGRRARARDSVGEASLAALVEAEPRSAPRPRACSARRGGDAAHDARWRGPGSGRRCSSSGSRPELAADRARVG